MWHNLNNVFSAVSTYSDLSPDIETRRCVNHRLRLRPALSLDQWFDYFWQPHGIAKPTVFFVYTYLEKYSGLQMSCVMPGDRLEQDLKLTLVCWFDWQLNLCDDFLSYFGIDISDRLDTYSLSTVEDLVKFLDSELLALHC
ncbi:hypothetical protein NG798_10940 [Ancylothrix sp. C2]|uniref:hypothetical protein n=1 Tax=Ancylothrix sp. D3o TaxID=2953691 RepID=UPI0021BB2419|nr:hypothetical protein [Ancylothrix sp. D3o]MCT7950305.1 hypothetical protein [Ancylothrix sp. D3o]